jgi:hypothetical protein
MPSPFPGMDPYLEDAKLWPAFHHQLITCLYQALLPGLVDRYRAHVGQRHYSTEQPLFTSIIQEWHHEEYIEILQRKDGGRLVTLVDVVSPTNRATETGRQHYLNKRREAQGLGANLVELDLVLQGRPMLDYSRENLPDCDYAVMVTRGTRPDRHKIWPTTLQKGLSAFELPLAADDHLKVDLRSLFARSYDLGGFASSIDYTRDPPTAMSEDDRRWLDDLLKQHKLR